MTYRLAAEELFKRQGNSFKLSKIYGNLIELKFDEFFAKNFVFQDYEIIAKRMNWGLSQTHN